MHALYVEHTMRGTLCVSPGRLLQSRLGGHTTEISSCLSPNGSAVPKVFESLDMVVNNSNTPLRSEISVHDGTYQKEIY